MSDKKPDLPSDFPADLKEPISKGWSKEPNKRPPIEEFKSVLNKMLTSEGKDVGDLDHSLSMPPEDRQTDGDEDRHRYQQQSTGN